MPGTACNKGFTLIELLLAMAVSGFVAVVGYQGLRTAIDAAEGLGEETETVAAIELAFSILEQDISQIISRPVRNELGSREVILSGGLSNESLLLFTRGGWENPRDIRRSELARINYQLVGKSLVRQRWTVLDRVSREEGLEQVVLLDNIEEVRLVFFNPFAGVESPEDGSGLAGDWVDWWQSERLGLNEDEPLPPAVRITLSITGFGEVSRVFTIVAA